MGQGTGFKFNGKGGDFFLLYLKNMFFTIITLGIYSFWARVNIKKYVYSSTVYGSEPFEYYGTGKEKFIGFLKSLGLIILCILAITIVNLILGKILGATLGSIIGIVIAYVVIIGMIPLIIIGSERYRLSRSSYRNVRFGFYGNARELVIIVLKGFFFCMITLGIYYPWFILDLKKYMIGNSYYGTQALSFSAEERGEFAKTVLLGLLLSIITLGIYGFWLASAIERFIWGHTSIQNKKFSCSLTGGTLFINTLISMLLVIFTLGLGVPWVIVRMSRVHIESISLEDEFNFAFIKNDFDKNASALADGLSDSADILDTLVGFLG